MNLEVYTDYKMFAPVAAQCFRYKINF